MEPDRIYIDVKVRDILEKMKKHNYLDFDNNKDIFLYAMALGSDLPTQISGKKDGFFLNKDLNVENEAMIYSTVLSELENIEDVTNKNMVYDVVQRMANTGFKIIEESLGNGSIENIEKRLLAELDEKYSDVINGL
jgi:hypothetical protein